MNDLISRSKLLEEIETWGGDVEALHEYISNMPTAYSVDKVVEELEKHKDTTDLTTIDEEMILGFTIYQGAFNEAIDRAIEIVKQGGVSDDFCEWKKVDEEGYKNCECNYDETIPDFFKYCPYCGKKIKVKAAE